MTKEPKKYTSVFCAIVPKNPSEKMETVESRFYYEDFPDGIERMSPVAQSEETQKEWEEFWNWYTEELELMWVELCNQDLED